MVSGGGQAKVGVGGMVRVGDQPTRHWHVKVVEDKDMFDRNCTQREKRLAECSILEIAHFEGQWVQ
jgi:hypothetical protein